MLACFPVYGVEGPCWLLPDFDGWWNNGAYRGRLLEIVRTLETEPSMLGVRAHLVAAAAKAAKPRSVITQSSKAGHPLRRTGIIR